MGKGILTLKVLATNKRLIIIISDNGVGDRGGKGKGTKSKT